MANKPYVYKRAEDLGIPVVEAKKPLFVGVTAIDVADAKKKNSKYCALARAAARLPQVNAAYIFRSTAFIEYPNRMERFLLPQSVQKEIVSFDRSRIFAEGTYQLSPIPASLTRKAQMDRYYDKKNASKKPAAKQGKTAAASKALDKHVGDRTVSGIKSSKAPEPLHSKAPTRYVHRTQYVRDLRDPA